VKNVTLKKLLAVVCSMVIALTSINLTVFSAESDAFSPFIDDYANIEAIEEVACRFPDMPIIMGHAGRGRHFETASVLRKH